MFIYKISHAFSSFIKKNSSPYEMNQCQQFKKVPNYSLAKNAIILFSVFSVLATSLFSVNALEVNEPQLNTNILIQKAWDSFSKNDKEWIEYDISSFDDIYGINQNRIGVVAELKGPSSEGYAIILIKENLSLVVEASKEIPSPYKKVLKNQKYYIYPFGYFSKMKQSFINLSTGRIESPEKASLSDPASFNVILRSVPSQTKYLLNYTSWFEKTGQHNSYSCVPTSFAMTFKYLHNRGRLTLSGGMDNINTAKIKLYDIMKNSAGLCRENNISNGVSTFGNLYSNKSLSTNLNQNCIFSTAVSEINSSFPVVLLFNGGTPNMYSVNHATTMVGYKNNVDSFGNITASYAIVVDPGSGSGVTKTMAWSNQYLYGYYILTVGY